MPKQNERYLIDQPNAWIAKCCDDLIRSTYRHDFRSCKCGHASCDGGNDYCHCSGTLEPVSSVRLGVELGMSHENGRGEVVATVEAKAWAKDGLFLGRFVLKHFEGDDAESAAWDFVADW